MGARSKAGLHSLELFIQMATGLMFDGDLDGRRMLEEQYGVIIGWMKADELQRKAFSRSRLLDENALLASGFIRLSTERTEFAMIQLLSHLWLF